MAGDLADDLDLVPARGQARGDGVHAVRARSDLGREVLDCDQDPQSASARLPTTSSSCSSVIAGNIGSVIARWE